MTTTTTGHGARLAPPRDPARTQREAARVLVATAMGLAAVLAGLDLAIAATFALGTWLATIAVPGSRVGPERRAAAVAGAPASGQQSELLRSTAAQMLALELAVDRLQSVLDSLREGVVVVDGGGEVVLANPESRQVLVRPEASPLGQLLWDVVVPDLVPAARQAFAELADEQRGPDNPVRTGAIQCGPRVVDLTAVRVRSRESGQDFGRVFLFVDATRSHELAHLKDRFLSGISHELRTPLTNICAYSEILRHLTPGETSEWPEFVRIVHEESLQLHRLVDTVFDYAQLESGEAVFQFVQCDVADTVRLSCERLRERVAVRGIELTCAIAVPLPQVRIDAPRFGHVLDHLLDNAIKFTPRGGCIRVSVAEEADSLVLRVDDSGPGVPESERESVFEKFHQLGNHLTDKVPGAGLGLATNKAVVTRMGGTLHCEAGDLGGARFVIILPAVVAAGGAASGRR